MARAPWINTNSQTSIAVGTNYQAPGLGHISTVTTEAQVRVPVRFAGTLSELKIRVETNSRTASSTLKSRINGADGTLLITVPATTTGDFEDLTNSDAIAAGDQVCYQLVVGSGGSAFTPRWISAIYDAAAGHVALECTRVPLNVTVASVTRFAVLAGNKGSVDATEAPNEALVRAPGTWRYLALYVSANARSTTTTWRTRIANANGNSTIAVSAGATGLFEDTTNTDTVASGNVVDLSIVTGSGTGTLTTQFTKIEALSDGTSHSFLGTGAPTFAAGGTFFRTMFGPGTTTTDVAGNRTPARLAAVFSGFSVRVLSNGVSATSNAHFMANGSALTQTVAIGAGATGLFEDATNTDSLSATDEIGYRFVAGAGGTNVQAAAIGVTMTVFITIGAVVALEHLLLLAPATVLPAESLLNTGASLTAPAEHLLGVTPSVQVPAEHLGGVAVAATPPAEHLGNLAPDVQVPAEHLLDVSGAVTSPTESLLGTGHTVTVALEHLLGLGVVVVLPMEHLADADIFPVDVENEGAIEWLGSVEPVAGLPAEHIAQVAASLVPVAEWLLGLIASVTGQSEHAGGLEPSSGAPIEHLLGIGAPLVGPVEWLADTEIFPVDVSSESAIEWLLAVRPTLSTPAEHLGGLAATVTVPVEFWGGRSIQVVVNAEHLRAVESSQTVTLESLLGSGALVFMPIEVLKGLAASGTFPIEWDGPIAARFRTTHMVGIRLTRPALTATRASRPGLQDIAVYPEGS